MYVLDNTVANRPVVLEPYSNFMAMPVKMKDLGTGDAVAPNTVKHMIEIIKEAGDNIYVRNCAEKIIAGVSPRNEMGEIAAIFYFIRDNARYTKDPRGVEFFYTPVEMLSRFSRGEVVAIDCDDYTNLILSLLRSIGYKTKIRIAGYDGHLYTHVYGRACVGGNGDGISGEGEKWVNLDAIRRVWPLNFEAGVGNPNRITKDFLID